MRAVVLIVLGFVFSAVILVLSAMIYLRWTGLGARAEPGVVETMIARAARRFSIPAGVRTMPNPVPASAEALADGMAHYADHCAVCHANDGGGKTEAGRGLFPKSPDMRLPATQELSDGELFYIIENGIRFTGMPGWSTGTKTGEESTWQLVHFIRRLPHLTSAELDKMKDLSPRSPEEIRQEIEEERFLNEGAAR